MSSLAPLSRLSLLLLVLVSAATAQVATSTITGRVTDATGAVVPGVNVTVVNTDTNFQFTATTNAEGLFRVQSLQPGPYRLAFQAGGFKRLTRDGVMLRTGDVLAVNVSLEVGDVAESIEVLGAAQLLETETSSVGSVLAGSLLAALPMYHRHVLGSVLLIPGVSAGFTQGVNVNGFNAAGQRSSAIGVFEDGVPENDTSTGVANIRSVQNSVAEVKVLTTTLPAEYGHSAGGLVSIVKKTGTNELHGMAGAYGRSRNMTHRNFFDRERPSQPTPGNPDGLRNYVLEPDANVGGPFVIPKLYNGRDKTFFFFGYLKMIEKKTNQYFGAVPDEAMKNGDFSLNGLGNPIYDPASTRRLADGSWTRDLFPNKRIPLSLFDPVARKVLEINPWRSPNETGAYTADGPSGNLSYDERSRFFAELFSFRLDHQFSPYVKLYGSWSYSHVAGWGRPTNIAIKEWDTNSTESPTTDQIYSSGVTWVISPTVVNDARLGYFRRRGDTYVPSYGKDFGKLLGIPNISADLLPAFGSGNQFAPASIYGLTLSGPSRSIDETISFRNDLTKIHGTHAFKMGYEILRLRMNSTQTNRPSGDFRFDGMTAGLQRDGNTAPRTGNTFAGFLLGWVRQAQFDQELASWLPRTSIQSFYFQDDWKFSPQLTLNLGLRYGNESPFTMKHGQVSNFSPTAIDDVAAGKPGAIVHPGGALNRRDNNNFQPRIGMAWHPLKKWVIRSGFGLNTIDLKLPTRRGQFQEYVAQANQQRPPGDPTPIYRISQVPAPVTYNIRPNGTSGFLGTNYGSRGSEWWDANLRNPYVLHWDLSVQYQISPTYVLDLTYQGSSGIGLIERWQTNTFPVDLGRNDPALQAAVFRTPQNYRPFANFGDINFRSNFGHSSYHGGTVKLERRFGQGLTFQTFFTFSKAIDSQDNDNSGSGVAPIQNRSLEKARSGFDRPRRYVNSLAYELPIGQGKRFLNRGGWLNRIVGGWETTWLIDLETGGPLTFTFANSPYNYYPAWVGNRRPDVVGKPELRDNWRDFGPSRFNQLTINPVLDINNFAYPAAFTPGNSGRNIVYGTPKIAMDASAQKNFRITERFNFQLRLDFHSIQKMLFNIYNFNPPTTSVDFQNPSTFGKITGGPTTAPWGGTPMLNMQLQLSW